MTSPGPAALHETDDLARLSISALVAEQAAGRLSAVEVVESRLRLLDQRGSEIGAVVAHDPDLALAQARAVDERRRRGEPLGPLAGVPVTVKDSFAVAGLHACQGTASSARTCQDDAPAVARLRSAGAVVLGKTNVPPDLADLRCDNAVHGRTANPWDTSRTPGGSSGGSAAAVSAGFSWGDLGSDLSGSIRVPAAWSGVYGHRPSNGVVAKRAHLPWPIDSLLDPTASVAGPLARRADDLLLLFTAMAGPAGVEARAWRLDLPTPSWSALAGLRVGLWRDESSAPVDDEVASALEALADRLRGAGATTHELGPTVLGTGDAQALFARLVADEITRGPVVDGGAPTVARAWADWEQQRVVRDVWETSIRHLDVVLAPVTPFAAPVDDELDSDALRLTPADDGHSTSTTGRELVGRWSCMANLAMGPSTVVPVGLGGASGLPIAVQLVAPYGHDLHTLRVARLLEQEGLVATLIPPGW